MLLHLLFLKALHDGREDTIGSIVDAAALLGHAANLLSSGLDALADIRSEVGLFESGLLRVGVEVHQFGHIVIVFHSGGQLFELLVVKVLQAELSEIVDSLQV